ncbi:sodium:solute symporter family transporter [Corynebacterium pseudodiphtheriticum]|uniref:sodium:solute symporter family transporter n=1 Tax=Corynebacterium pseudodiphtheriticum TaxID=37637 RepID=UPI00234D4AAF|nr:Na+/galactose cotransporter [Corynebacterium pseudodiphtheriticum]MDC7115384.1 Na+/galactose cotransporter [Corynebacterium pseudodiphtheriticum]
MQEDALLLNASWVDYTLVAIYFLFVLGIGWAAKSKVSSSIDFFLSGRSLPAWVTGLAFISANLGAVEIVGMSANGVQYGFETMHYFWIGAIPAMVFLGIVMMPFYYGSKVRSVPEFMRRRFGNGAHLVNALSFALAQLLIAGATVTPLMDGSAEPNDAMLYLMRDLLPNGLLGIALAGLLAAFMAGMAANISAFNTVFSYDLWQTYMVKDREDDYYTRVGRLATIGATVIAVFTALLASNFGNVMDYLQTLFGFFNAPLFATFILGMFWKRMTPTAGWAGLVAGTGSAIVYWAIATFSAVEAGLFNLPGQGTAFVAASLAFVVDILVSIVVSLVTKPKPDEELVGFVKSVTPKENLTDSTEDGLPWYRRTVPLGVLCLVLVVILNIIFI